MRGRPGPSFAAGLEAGGWGLGVGNGELGAGSGEPEVGSWELGIGNAEGIAGFADMVWPWDCGLIGRRNEKRREGMNPHAYVFHLVIFCIVMVTNAVAVSTEIFGHLDWAVVGKAGNWHRLKSPRNWLLIEQLLDYRKYPIYSTHSPTPFARSGSIDA